MKDLSKSSGGLIDFALLVLVWVTFFQGERVLYAEYGSVFSDMVTLGVMVPAVLRLFALIWSLILLVGIIQRFRAVPISNGSFLGLLQVLLSVTGVSYLAALCGVFYVIGYAYPPVPCEHCVRHLVLVILFNAIPFLVLTITHFRLFERLRPQRNVAQ